MADVEFTFGQENEITYL